MVLDPNFEQRKKDHLYYSLNQSAQSLAHDDWDRIFLIPEALPEFNFDEVSIDIESMGRRWKTPFFISSMTAGTKESFQINSILAEVCAQEGWMLGVGSQRKELTMEETGKEWKKIRQSYPEVLFASNIGISQLIHTPLETIQRLIDNTEAVMLFVHTNPLQECLQIEGTPHFKGGLKALEKLVSSISVPVVVKEVGSGVSVYTIEKLKNIGISAVDLSGRGGTHWGRVEGLRAPSESLQAKASQTFKDWGMSTPRVLHQWYHFNQTRMNSNYTQGNSVESSFFSNSKQNDFEIWASGGIRNGLQAAKSLAMGAHRIGLARPFLEAALKGPNDVKELMTLLEFELKVSLFCTGMKTISDLKDPSKERKVWLWEME